MTRAAAAIAWTLACLATAALPACDDGGPVARGFGSRQLLALRDPTFAFEGGRGDLVLYSVGELPSHLSVDIATGAVAEHDADYSDLPFPDYSFPHDPAARFHCSWGGDSMGNVLLTITDGQTGELTTIGGLINTLATCPSESDPTLQLWRRDAAGLLTLWTGRYDDLQMAPIDLAVVDIVQYPRGTDVAVRVLAGYPAQPDALGIFAIDVTTFAVEEVIPPALDSATWAEGATPAGGSSSASVFFSPPGGAAQLHAFAIGNGHFAYWRAMADGSGLTLFIGPFSIGPARELAIFHGDNSVVIDASVLVRIRVGSADDSAPHPPLPVVWQRTGAAANNDLLVWDDGRQRLVTCPWASIGAVAGMASGDRDRLLFSIEPVIDPTHEFSANTGSLLLVDLTRPASDACVPLAASGVSAAGLSPDDSTMFWLTKELYPSEKAELWLASSDGSAPRKIGTDRIETDPPDGPRFVGPSQLELELGDDLVWIDVHDDRAQTHPIAQHVSGIGIDRGRWLITRYDASAQDGTATLGVINRDTGGAPRMISRDVKTFMSPDIYDYLAALVIPSPTRKAGDPLRIVYLVQGRNPSSQDGLWVATINASDIP
jgi:hypothetical protein